LKQFDRSIRPEEWILPLGSQQSWMPMQRNAIMDEVRQLYSVSDRLDALAEQHPLVSDALAPPLRHSFQRRMSGPEIGTRRS
jgi:hypothetical protein